MWTAYRDIMEHVSVTEDMRRRILTRLEENASVPARPAIRFPLYRRLVAAAACLLLLLGGILAAGRVFSSPEVPSDLGNVGNGIPSFTEVTSLQELSQTVGFPVEGLSHIPFTVTETHYTVLMENTAEIRYIGDGTSAVYRKTPGQTDPSGDYGSYAAVLQWDISGLTVTLKGDGTLFSLALWQDGDYSYSAQLSTPVSTAVWETMLSA